MRATVAAAGFALLLGAACFAGVRGSGNLKAETRDVPDFDAVAVGAGIRATITIGPRKPIRIEGDDNVLPLVQTTVRDGVLKVEFETHESISAKHEVRVA